MVSRTINDAEHTTHDAVLLLLEALLCRMIQDAIRVTIVNSKSANRTSIQMEARLWLVGAECRELCDLAGIAHDVLLQQRVLPFCPDFYASVRDYLRAAAYDEQLVLFTEKEALCPTVVSTHS